MYTFYESEFIVHVKCKSCKTVSRTWKEKSSVYKCAFCGKFFRSKVTWPVVEYDEWGAKSGKEKRISVELLETIRDGISTVELYDPIPDTAA